jgi:probable Rubsico expression protein CbbX
MDQFKGTGDVDTFMFKQGVSEILEKLDDEMIGMREVKERVRGIASLLVVDKMRLRMGLDSAIPSLHMSFTGSPGTGKTTIALRMGQILQRMGYCRSGHVVVATRDDLVGQYVGHTAPKTKEMVKKAMGGILLVDEAYYLYNEENDRDYGAECVEILLNVMETLPEDLIVIFAGYKDLMTNFFASVPGLNSRVGSQIDFPDYSDHELVDIGDLMCGSSDYKLSPDARHEVAEFIRKRKELPFFSNARTVRNCIDMARTSSARRVYEEILLPGYGPLSYARLTSVEAQDIPSIEDYEREQGNVDAGFNWS